MDTIDSVEGLSPIEFDRRYFQTHVPVIHRGAIKEESYFRDWTFDYLKSKCGTTQVKISHSKKGYYKFSENEIVERKTLQFAEAIDHFTSKDIGKYYYLQQSSIPETFPELVPEVTRPSWLLDSDVIFNQNLWIGGSGCVSPLHFDLSANFLIQVTGRKRIILFAPHDYQNLYPGKEVNTEHVSEIDLRDVDHDRFPLFKNAKPIEIVLGPGDLLYLPSRWWHEVHSLDACISVNYWFGRFDIVDALKYLSVPELCGSIQLFLDNGSDINATNIEGEILLLKAIHQGFSNVVEAMLKMGANPNSASTLFNPGATALAYAKQLGHEEIVNLLSKYGAAMSLQSADNQ